MNPAATECETSNANCMMTNLRALCRLGLVLCFAFASPSATAQTRNLVGYYPGWLSSDAPSLSATSKNYSHVIVAFAKPDFSWPGKDSWSGTGLQFVQPPAEIKRQIATLKAQGVTVLLAVGGATYLNWGPLTAERNSSGPITAGLRLFVSEMGFDGLDVDYEVDGAGPAQIAEYRAAVKVLRRAAAGRILSLAAWSTGADCTAATGSEDCGGKLSIWSGRAGRERLLLRDPDVVDALNMVNVMSYDAGVENYDPVRAWRLYRALLPARISVQIGFETAPEGWGGATLVKNDAAARCTSARIVADSFNTAIGKPYSVTRSLRLGPLTKHRNSNPKDGAMLWHILKDQSLPACDGLTVASPDEIERMTRTMLDKP